METTPRRPNEEGLTPDEHWAAAGLRRGEMGFEPPRGVTRIDVRPGLAHVSLPTEGRPRDLARIFRPLTEAGVSVDLIKLHDNSLHFALADAELDRARQVLAELGHEPEVVPQCAILTVYAADMRSIPGVMGRIVSALHRAGVGILEMDDSYNSVFCLIQRHQAPPACEALAAEFELETQPTQRPNPWR